NAVSRLHFGSCNHQDEPQAAWTTMASRRRAGSSSVFAWLGDIIYADRSIGPVVHLPATADRIQECYEQQAAHPDYARFAAETSVVGVYDDHDRGYDGADVTTFDAATVRTATAAAVAGRARRRHARVGISPPAPTPLHRLHVQGAASLSHLWDF